MDPGHPKAPQPHFKPTRKLIYRVYAFIEREATFFRIHLAAFVFIPLIISGIFHACNGKFPVKYIDSLFLCYSAMTVTGLGTVNLSTLTVMQQVILFVLMAIGDITIVSWIMVLFRKNFFKNHCEIAVYKTPSLLHRTRQKLSGIRDKSKISPPVDVKPLAEFSTITPIEVVEPTPQPTLAPNPDKESSNAEPAPVTDVQGFSSSPDQEVVSLPPLSPTRSKPGVTFTTSLSITPSQVQRRHNTRGAVPAPKGRTMTMLTASRVNLPSSHPAAYGPEHSKYRDLGGFPGPVDLAQRFLKHASPRAYRAIERKLTMPVTQTLTHHEGGAEPVRDPNQKQMSVSWLDIPALIVGRNSAFQTDDLSDEELEILGGTEYRALRMLSYLVPAYFVFTQLLAYVIFAPWLSTTSKYDQVFAAQPREVKKPWFGLFQVMSAYTGGGLSLVDLGMLPFADAYLMIFPLIFIILAGNHALPIFLRLTIWILSKSVDKRSEHYKTLSYLLDHPRRCFIYLFPSHQTWFLVIVLALFSAIEWVAFEVLNQGLEVYESIPIGPRIVGGLFQGISARASGFSISPLASLAPALLFLYLVMMYIAIYPIAISIRSTNVYEEKSLGVFEESPETEDEEPDMAELGKNRRERINRYLGWHLRRQISTDTWWLVWGVFLVAVIERNNLLDENKKWFDLFRVLFELVSAFGGIGLSLGLPTDNYSFSGALRPLSKLVIIVIMLRGRHRGLPVAVDRAVMLPFEHAKHIPQAAHDGTKSDSRTMV